MGKCGHTKASRQGCSVSCSESGGLSTRLLAGEVPAHLHSEKPCPPKPGAILGGTAWELVTTKAQGAGWNLGAGADVCEADPWAKAATPFDGPGVRETGMKHPLSGQ